MILSFAKTIKEGVNKIEIENNVVDDDPNGEAVKSKMALVYDNSVVDKFFGLLKGTTSYYIDNYNHTQEKLEQEVVNLSDKIDYNHFEKQLIFRGVMTESLKSSLVNLVNVSSQFKTAIEILFSKGQHDFAEFFDKFPELKIFYTKFVSTTNPNENETEKIKSILEDFMPTLKKRLKSIFVRQTLTRY